MKARYQYRFYPTDQQRQSLAQLFGCVRVVWNDALAFSKSSKYPGYNALSKSLTLSKKTTEREWLNSVSSVPLQQSLKQLEVAYKNYFDSLKGKRKGRKVGQPRFKKKTNDQSATFTKAAFSIKNKEVCLAKIGNLKPIWSRELPSEPSSVTVIKDCANRYFLSFVVEVEPVQIDAKNPSIGIDLGIKTFAVMSNSGMVKNRRLARSISLQGWREFRTLCEAKSEKLGREFHVINRWEPTSQIGSDCGFKWGKLDLSIRSVLCLNCGTEQDRDENAARNIEQSRHRALGDSKRTQRQSKTCLQASVSEASRITVASAR